MMHQVLKGMFIGTKCQYIDRNVDPFVTCFGVCILAGLLVDNVNTLIRSQCGSICYMVWCVYTGGFTMKHLDL